MPGFEKIECVQVERLVESIRPRKESYLRVKGWEASSSTPGCYWMWFKEVRGKHYGCSTDDAFRIQSNLDRDEYATKYPKEFQD